MADSPSDLEPPPPAYELTQQELDTKLADALERSLTVTRTPGRAPNVHPRTERQPAAPVHDKNSHIDEFEEWNDSLFEENERKQKSGQALEDGMSSIAEGHDQALSNQRPPLLEDSGLSNRADSSLARGTSRDQSLPMRSGETNDIPSTRPLASAAKEAPSWLAEADLSPPQSGPSSASRVRSRRLPAIPGPRTMPQANKERPSWYNEAGLDSIPTVSSSSEGVVSSLPAPRAEKERPSWFDDAGLGSVIDAASHGFHHSVSASTSMSSLTSHTSHSSPHSTAPMPRLPISPSSTATSPTLSQSAPSLPPLEEDPDFDDEAPPAFTPIAPPLPGPSISPPPPTSSVTSYGQPPHPMRHSVSSPMQPHSAPPQQVDFISPMYPPPINPRHSMPANVGMSLGRVDRGVVSYNTHISLDPQVAYGPATFTSGFSQPVGMSMPGGAVNAAALYSPAVSAFMQPAKPTQSQSYANSPSPQPDGSPSSPFHRPPSSNHSRSPPPLSTTPTYGPPVPSSGGQRPYDASLAESLGQLAQTIQRNHAERFSDPQSYAQPGQPMYQSQYPSNGGFPPQPPRNILYAHQPMPQAPLPGQSTYRPHSPLPPGAAPSQAPGPMPGAYAGMSAGTAAPMATPAQQGMQMQWRQGRNSYWGGQPPPGNM